MMLPISWLPSFLSRPPIEIALIAGIGIVLVGAVVFASFRVDQRVLLGVALVLAVLQGFKPIGYISIALLFSVALLPGTLRRAGWRGLRDPWFAGLGCLAAWQLLSVLWAHELGSVAYAVISTVALASLYALARQTIALPGGLHTSLMIAAPFVAAQSMLTIVFRFWPAMEMAYLTSSVSQFLSEPEVADLRNGVLQNVSDPDKAGGLLLNGNVASLFLGLAAVLYIWQFTFSRSRLHLTVGLLALVATCASGSKSPIPIIIVLTALTGLVAVAAGRSRRVAAVVAGVTLACVGIVAVALTVRPILFDQVIAAMGDRGRLWSLAASEFPGHAVLGLGYGGWTELITTRFGTLFGTSRPFQSFPPHNLFIQAWADSGIVELLLVLFLSLLPVVMAVKVLVRSANSSRSARELWVAGLLLAGVAWPLLHGLMDTTRFFGENHTLAFYACLVAAVTAASSTISPSAPELVEARSV